MGYCFLAIFAASKPRRIHLSLFGCPSSVSITSQLHGPVVYASTTRKQQPSCISNWAQGASPCAGAASFQLFPTCRPSISSSCPVWTKAYFRDSSPQDTCSAEPLLAPNPCPDPNSGKFPFPFSLWPRLFLCYVRLSIPLGLTLAVLQAATSQPSAQLGFRANTDQQHTLFPPLPSLYSDNNKPALDDFQKAATAQSALNAKLVSLHVMPWRRHVLLPAPYPCQGSLNLPTAAVAASGSSLQKQGPFQPTASSW